MRLLAAPLLAVLGLLGSGVAAAAPLPAITVDPGYGPPLTTVKVVGRSFCATCGPVALSVAALNVDTAPVRADGSFSHLVRIPGSTRPGAVTIAASQGASTARTTFTVTVFQPAPKTYSPPSTVPPPGNLPSGGVTGTPVQSSSPPGPAPSTASATTAPSDPSSSVASQSVSIEPGPVSPVAGHRSSAHGSAAPITALIAAAALLAAGGVLWWLRRRRPGT